MLKGLTVKLREILSKAIMFLNRHYCLFALLSGFLTALTLTFSSLFILAFFSLIPLFYALFKYGKGIKSSFKLMFVYGLGFYLVLYTWFYSLYPLDWMGIDNGSSLLYISLIYVGIVLIQALQMSLAGIIYGLIRPDGAIKIFSAGFAYIVIEWLQEQTIWGMPWGRLALSQAAFLPNVQSSALLGSIFVSFIILVVNALFAYPLAHGLKLNARKICAAAGAAILLCNMLFGFIRISAVDSTDYETESVKVASIQGNFASGTKWENSFETFQKFSELTAQAASQGAKIVLWPETAVPVYIEENSEYDRKYKQLAEELDIYLIVGGFTEFEEKDYTALLMYSPDGVGGVANAYYKRHLVPFGEYVPYRDFFVKLLPFLSQLRMLGSDLTAGSETYLFQTEYGKISGLICFDSIFPALSLSDIKEGSQFIVMGTNDSYYDGSANQTQHNYHAVLRAIENGRYIARAANTGISSVISPSGQFLDITEILTEDYAIADVYFTDRRTLFSYTGDIVVYIGFAFIAACALYGRFNSGKIKQTNNKTAI